VSLTNYSLEVAGMTCHSCILQVSLCVWSSGDHVLYSPTTLCPARSAHHSKGETPSTGTRKPLLKHCYAKECVCHARNLRSSPGPRPVSGHRSAVHLHPARSPPLLLRPSRAPQLPDASLHLRRCPGRDAVGAGLFEHLRRRSGNRLPLPVHPPGQ